MCCMCAISDMNSKELDIFLMRNRFTLSPADTRAVFGLYISQCAVNSCRLVTPLLRSDAASVTSSIFMLWSICHVYRDDGRGLTTHGWYPSNVDQMLTWCWPNVAYAGPMVNQHLFNVLCLLWCEYPATQADPPLIRRYIQNKNSTHLKWHLATAIHNLGPNICKFWMFEHTFCSQ